MNFKTFISEANKSDREPVVVGFDRSKILRSKSLGDTYEDIISIEYKGEKYRIVQEFSLYKNINSKTKVSVSPKVHSALLIDTGLMQKIDRPNSNFAGYSYIDLKPPQRTIKGGQFYTDLVLRTLNVSKELYDVLGLGIMGESQRRRYIRKFKLGMKPKTAKHFGDIIGKLRE